MYTEVILLQGPNGAGHIYNGRQLHSELSRVEPHIREEITEIHTKAFRGQHTLKEQELPFRAPHHTVSEAGMVGAGGRPGEVSLAHGGVLYLDQVVEFRTPVLNRIGDALSQGKVLYRLRDGYQEIPSKPQLVILSAEYCPCGSRRLNEFDPNTCACTVDQILSYHSRLTLACGILGVKRIHHITVKKETERLNEASTSW